MISANRLISILLFNEFLISKADTLTSNEMIILTTIVIIYSTNKRIYVNKHDLGRLEVSSSLIPKYK